MLVVVVVVVVSGNRHCNFGGGGRQVVVLVNVAVVVISGNRGCNFGAGGKVLVPDHKNDRESASVVGDTFFDALTSFGLFKRTDGLTCKGKQTPRTSVTGRPCIRLFRVDWSKM